MEYYFRAMKVMESKVENPTYFIFSEDTEFIKTVFKGLPNIVIVSEGKLNALQDLKLMTLVKHMIIANSTFSWWGAWLNGNKDKIIIAPQINELDVKKKNKCFEMS